MSPVPSRPSGQFSVALRIYFNHKYCYFCGDDVAENGGGDDDEDGDHLDKEDAGITNFISSSLLFALLNNVYCQVISTSFVLSK